MKNMSKRERYIAIAAVSFVTVAILYNFIIDPVLHEWQSLNIETESKKAALKTDIAILSVRKTVEENYSKFSKYVRSGKSEEESVAEVLSYLEDLSRSDSCLISNIKPIGTKDYGTYKELLIDLTAEGGSNQFTKFLYDIETTKNMILKVRHFMLTSKAGQEGALRGTFLISKIIIE
ncbi:MAG: hypothetical protein PHX20_01660 [Candidatus Omnitrophica bacterium]|nr:hypothetical protein [Candidatus Omnitrophota bacterium]